MYAAENNFDPLLPAQWYLQSRNKILAFPVCYLFYFPFLLCSLSFRPCLSSSPPLSRLFCLFSLNIGTGNARNISISSWKYSNNNYGIISWNRFTKIEIQQIVLYVSNNTKICHIIYFKKVLIRILIWILIWILAHWRDPKARRKFFEDFAKKKGFDALNPDNWYGQSFKEFLEEKVFSSSRTLRFPALLFFSSRPLPSLFPLLSLKKRFTALDYWSNRSRISSSCLLLLPLLLWPLYFLLVILLSSLC